MIAAAVLLPAVVASEGSIFGRGARARLHVRDPRGETASGGAPGPGAARTPALDGIVGPRRFALLPPRGGAAAALNPFPSGRHPFGYGLTDLGRRYLSYDGSLDSDVGRFLSSLKGGGGDAGKTKRKTKAALKEQWLEVVRMSKKAQSMRIYRKLDEMIVFCLEAGFVD
ncbi:hypothetical protein ACHAWF_000784 [Thalassiosira exigua]